MSMYRATLRSTKYPTPRYDNYRRTYTEEEEQEIKLYEGIILIAAIICFVLLPIYATYLVISGKA